MFLNIFVMGYHTWMVRIDNSVVNNVGLFAFEGYLFRLGLLTHRGMWTCMVAKLKGPYLRFTGLNNH